METKGYTITKPCDCCKSTGKIKTCEGNLVNCPYCRGEKEVIVKDVHPSHDMSKSRCEIIAPISTPRFYSVRHCISCGKEEWKHAAGHFLHGLNFPCKNNPEIDL